MQKVDAKEFHQWCAYFEIQPWGVAGQDARTLASTSALLHSRGAKNFEAHHVLPWMREGGIAGDPSLADEDSAARDRRMLQKRTWIQSQMRAMSKRPLIQIQTGEAP